MGDKHRTPAPPPAAPAPPAPAGPYAPPPDSAPPPDIAPPPPPVPPPPQGSSGPYAPPPHTGPPPPPVPPAFGQQPPHLVSHPPTGNPAAAHPAMPGYPEPSPQQWPLPSPPQGTPAFLPASGGPPDAAAVAGPGRPPKRRLDPRKRRIVEVIALATLLPLTLGLQWFDNVRQIQLNIEPAESVTVVPRGGAGTLAHARWAMLGRVAGGSTGTPASSDKPQGSAKLTLSIGVKALDAQGTKEASAANLKFWIRDRAGNKWSAEADYAGQITGGPPVGKPVPITVTAEIPERLLTSVVLDVAQSGAFRPKGPVRVLRFAH